VCQAFMATLYTKPFNAWRGIYDAQGQVTNLQKADSPSGELCLRGRQRRRVPCMQLET
jgi:hypothetical protein